LTTTHHVIWWMKYRTCGSSNFLPFAELQWPEAHRATSLWKIGKKRVLNENDETEHRPIERTMRVLNLSVGLRMTEGGIRLFADCVCNEQRATAFGQRIVRMFAFLLWEDSRGEADNNSEWFFHDIFSEFSIFLSERKRSSLWCLWSSSCSLLVSINLLKHKDSSFSSVTQSKSNPFWFSP